MKTALKNLIKNERGLETVEWAIMVGMLVGGLILVIAAISAWVLGQMTQLKNDMGA